MQGVPIGKIARPYFDSDTTDYVDEPEQLERCLRASIAKHGSARPARAPLPMVEQASKLAVAEPQASHSVNLRFRPLIARHLTAAGIGTLGELVALANRRGGSWWRSIPRIGVGRAH